MPNLIPLLIRTSEPSDLSAFGITLKQYFDRPSFYVQDGHVWKSACWLYLYDDGRIHVALVSKLTDRELRTIYGVIDRTFEGGVKLARHEGWTRLRPTKKRKVGRYRMHYYVRVDADENPHAQLMVAAQCEDSPEGIRLSSLEATDAGADVTEQANHV